MECVGAIDQGTQSTRFTLFDGKASVVATARRNLTQIYPKPGLGSVIVMRSVVMHRWCEHDPLEIMDTVYACMEEAMKVTRDSGI